MSTLLPVEVRHLTAPDAPTLRLRATVVLIDAECERFTTARLAMFEDQVLLARHCPSTADSELAALVAARDELRDALAASARVVDLRVTPPPPGLDRGALQAGDASYRRARALVMAAVMALVDSETLVIDVASMSAPTRFRVADAAPQTAARVGTLLDEMDRVAADHAHLIRRLTVVPSGPRGTVATERSERRRRALASIEVLACRQAAMAEVNAISQSNPASRTTCSAAAMSVPNVSDMPL